MFSRIDFESSLNKLRIFFGVSTVENFLKKGDYKNKKEINDYFLDAYATIPKLLLQEVRDHHALRYYLLESKREDLIEAEICKGDIYYVYDLTLFRIL